MDVRVLVGTLVLDEVVDVHTHFTGHRFSIVHAHHDAGGVHVVHHTATVGRDHGAGVHSRHALNARANQWLFGTQHRHRLTRHVRTHQRAVGVIVLQERHQRGSHRHDLCRRHVHVLHTVCAAEDGFTLFTGRHQITRQATILVELCVRLSDHVLAFFDGREVIDLVGDLAVHHAAVRRLDEAVLVQAGVQSQRVDQTNVGTFRRFDRADATVVGHVHVTHLKACALTGQTAWAQSGHTALVRDFGQRVGLVHELRQLRCAEEFFQSSRDRLAVDQVMGHQRLLLSLTQTFLHSLFDTRQASAVLVLSQFAHAAHAAVAQMVDIVHLATAIAQIHEDLDHGQDVFVGQHHGACGFVAADLGVELHAAHAREVVRVGVVEQALEQGLHGVFRRRLAGAHHAVDGHARSELIGRFINAQGLRDVGALVEFVGVDDLQVTHASGAQFLKQGFGQLFVGLGDDFAGVRIHDVAGHDATNQEVFGHADVGRAGLLQLARVARGDALVLGDDDLAALVGDVETGNFTLEAIGHKLHLCAAVHQAEVVVDEEVGQDRLGVQANGLEQRGDGHLATTVHAEVQDVLRIEFEVQPRATVRNDAGGEQQLARAVRLALVVFEEHAWRAVQLGHDHAFRAVDDERALVSHQGHFAHVDLLLFHFLDHFGLRSRRLAVINDELHLGTHGRRKRQTTGLAFTYIKGRLGQVVLNELHLHKTVVRDDRESCVESGLKPFDGSFLGGRISLQESGVRILLHLQQVRNFEHAIAAAETFANSLAFGVRIGHEISGQRHESWVFDD